MADAALTELALPHGSDPRRLARELSVAHDRFVETGAPGTAVRGLVADSWRRCLADGVDPEATLAGVELDDAALEAARRSHPLFPAMPLIRRLLVEDAADAGHVVAVSDAAGRLLWVEGSSSLRSRAEHMTFLPGANWSEACAGTNAPGTALALERPVQIFGAEHLARPVTPWSCSAAPIRDPDTGAVLGVLDLTGGPEVAAPHSLSLVRAAVAAVESELRVARLSRPPLDPPAADVAADVGASTLRVLGVRGALLGQDASATRLSLRHSELLLLLTAAPEGMTAGELVAALGAERHAPVTVRAELSRLRSLVHPLVMRSRPYRLVRPPRTDADDVRAALLAGELRRAVDAYRGPVLPTSVAPDVVRMRERLHADVRAALLGSGDPDALLGFVDTPHGRDDVVLWRAALAALPASSPRRAQVQAQVHTHDR